MSKRFNTLMLCIQPALLLCPIAYASNNQHVSTNSTIPHTSGATSHWFAGLESAGIFLSPTGSHTNRKFTNRDASLGAFNVRSGSTGMNIGAFVGYAIQNNQHWFSAYRVNIEGTHTVITPKVKGKWEYTLHSPANNYRYQYYVAIKTLGANIGVDVYRWHHFAVFLQAGTGVDWLTSKDFSQTPEAGSDNVSLRFTGAKKSNLYYQGKIGVRYTLHHCAISLAYTYANLGKVNTGEGETGAGALASGLNDKIKTNNIQLALIYNF